MNSIGLSPHGNTMTGAWQGPVPQQVTFTRATPETAWAIPEPPPPLKAMAADADPSFDVAVIKPSPPDATGTRLNIDRSGRMHVNNWKLDDLVSFAYRLHPQQLRGMPEALGSERFDVEAKPDTPGQPSDIQVRSMLRKLLTERFMIVSHGEKRELTVYAISVAKTGPRLTKTQSNATLPSFSMGRAGRALAQNATLSDFAGWLQSIVLDRPVVDQSGIDGRYDFTLKWTPDETQFGGFRRPSPAAAEPDAETFPDLFTAMQQQLGLKLESVKAPVDVLVIDRIEKPSEN